MEELLQLPPSLIGAVDVTRLALDAQDGYLLSQIDGKTSAAVLCDILGTEPNDVIARLSRLEELGVVKWRGTPAPASVKSVVRKTEAAPVDLPADEQAHIRTLADSLGRLTHWELLGLTSDISPAAIKRAYFAASKRYHPDRYFGRQLGEYRTLLEAVFRAVKHAYDVLSDDDARAKYAAKHPPPEAPVAPPAATASEPEDREALLEARRQQILEERRKKKFGKKVAEAQSEVSRKAQDMYEAGMRQLGAGQASAAARSFRLALSYEPHNAEFRAKLKMAEEESRIEQAKRAFEQGEVAAATGNGVRAAELFAEAADAAPQKTGYAVAAAEAYLATGKAPRAWVYAERALGLAPSRLEVRLVAAEALEARGMVNDALAQLDEASRLDPSDRRVKNAIARLTQRKRR